MGAVAALLADIVIVTDDNPRGEDPASIRRAILAACPGAIEIGDRADAIRRGLAMLRAGDALLLAGKGHETGQIVGGKTLPFSDADVARAALRNWVAPHDRALDRRRSRQPPRAARSTRAWQASGVSIDSRSARARRSVRGARRPAVRRARLSSRTRSLMELARPWCIAAPPAVTMTLPLLIVRDTMAALGDLGAAARKRSGARVVAVTGSVGKTGTKEALRRRSAGTARPMPRPAASTIIGACRCRWRACRTTRASACSRSA